MIRQALRAALFLSTLVLTSLAFADGYSIKRTPKLGDTFKYKLDIVFDASLGQGTLKATLLEKVILLDKDGNFSVQQSQIDAAGTFDGEKIEISPRTPITLVYKPNGQVTSITGDLVEANSYRMENLGALIDPGHPVKMGEVWASEIKPDKALGTHTVQLQYKLESESKVGDIDTLCIKATSKEVDPASDTENPPSNDFTIWISKSDGSLVKLESHWHNAMFPGQSAPISASIKLTRVAS